jgi:ribosome-interacting GTPase 1
MAKTQKNKATSFHLGQLKAKLAKLKRDLLTPSSGGGGGPGGNVTEFRRSSFVFTDASRLLY